jgi:nucleoid-associated protein YgaU
MGKVEKIVVLSVLFLITLILVVSLTGPFEDTAPQDAVQAAPARPGLAGPTAGADRPAVELAGPTPGRRASRQVAQAEASPTAPAAASGSERVGLLDAAVGTAAAGGSTAGTILVTADGLLPSYLPEYRFYACRDGDSWRSIADRYYGTPARADLLRRANEGRRQVVPGEKILVPVIDLTEDGPVGGGGHAPVRPPVPPQVPARSATPPAGVAPGYHVVVEGESLWKIAKDAWGEGSRWKEIYEANRDVLASPDDLSAGQRLRIP